LGAGETLSFNGIGELDGAFRIISGAGDDSLLGGSGDDRIYGGLGADLLFGGGGADTFEYRAAAESSSTSYDTIVGFDYRVDKIDLPERVGNFSAAVESGRLDTATFDADLGLAMAGVLNPYSAAVFTPDSGDLAGRIFGIVDANGISGYQAGEDFVAEFVAPASLPDPTIDFFI
jgi:Ca2+-binding RTX toxin-like protein